MPVDRGGASVLAQLLAALSGEAVAPSPQSADQSVLGPLCGNHTSRITCHGRQRALTIAGGEATFLLFPGRSRSR